VHIYFTDPSVFFHLQTADTYPSPTLLSLHVGLPRLVAKENSLLRRTLSAAQWVTTTSEAMLNEARQLVPEIVPYSSFIYNGIECRAPVKPLPKERQEILCVGRLVKDKGFDLALRAFAMLREHFPTVRMIIAGDGAAREPLKQLAQELGIGERVIFPGWVKHEDIPNLINEASLVVMPSRWEEAFGLVAVEAALMERPVVATRVGGLPEVVADGITGMLVEKENSEALAAAISYLLRNPAEAANMGRVARRRAQALFSLDGHVDAYQALYRKLVESYLPVPLKAFV
jgi:glycogen(starch) synthase